MRDRPSRKDFVVDRLKGVGSLIILWAIFQHRKHVGGAAFRFKHEAVRDAKKRAKAAGVECWVHRKGRSYERGRPATRR